MAAEPSSVRFARSEAMRWLDENQLGDENLATSVALAISEAVANVVRHAYPSDARGRVDVGAELSDESVRIEVCDAGDGLAAKTSSDSLGLGFPVIGRVSDGVTVSSDRDGTTVLMRFDLVPLRRRSLTQAARQAGARIVGVN